MNPESLHPSQVPLPERDPVIGQDVEDQTEKRLRLIQAQLDNEGLPDKLREKLLKEQEELLGISGGSSEHED